MQQFINSFMGVVCGMALMTSKVLGTPIIDAIQLRIYPGEITGTGLTIFGALYDVITVVSLIGMIITIIFSVILLRNVFKSYKNN